jgi:hypothetical protein
MNAIQWYPARSVDLASGLTHPSVQRTAVVRHASSHKHASEAHRGTFATQFWQAWGLGCAHLGWGVRACSRHEPSTIISEVWLQRPSQMMLMPPTNDSRPCVQPVYLADSEDVHCNYPEWRSTWRIKSIHDSTNMCLNYRPR